MATVTGYTAARMKEIEDTTVVDGHVDAGHHLILTTREGTEIDAGDVAATAKVAVADTSSVDMKVSGAGSDSSPFVLSADVKEITAAQVSSGVFTRDRLPSLTEKAYLDPFYRGNGPAKISFTNGGALSSEAYDWDVPYVPNGSRVVNVRKDGSTWRIVGHTNDDKKPLPLTNGWDTYNNSAIAFEWDEGTYRKLPSGIVVLSGLIRKIGNVPTGDIIAILPEGYRPDYEIIFGVNSSDISRYVSIKPNGEIRTGENFAANSYVSLDNICYPAAGVADWTFIDPQGTAGSDHTFQNSWTEYNVTTYGRARYWKDPYGFVWTQGMIKGGSTAHDTLMFTWADSCKPYKTLHIATASNASLGVLGVSENGSGPRYRNGSLGNTWFSVTGPAWPTAEAMTKNLWINYATMGNNWVPFVYQTQYTGSLGVTRRGDGLVVVWGMIGNGTVGTRIHYLSKEMLPAKKKIFHVVSGDARGRFDISGEDDMISFSGSMYAQQGNSAWMAVDNLKFAP